MRIKNNQWNISVINKILLFMIFAIYVSCDKNNDIIIESYQDFTNGNWNYNNTSVFEFEISDTTSHYLIYYNIRNTLAYEYYNIYVKFQLLSIDGKLMRSNMHETILMELDTGKPYGSPKPLGSAVANVYTTKTPLIEKIHFSAPGKYTFTLRHYMRNESLEGIIGVGLTIKKYQKR